MIFEGRNLTQDGLIECQDCVIGSGAGGSAAAWELSRQGRHVLVLEAGKFLLPSQFTQREDDMYPELFYEAGGRRTTNKAIRVLHGKGFGGSTIHNLNLCKDLPQKVADLWDLPDFSFREFSPFLTEVREKLGVTPIQPDQVNLNNVLLKRGLDSLGYSGGLLSHNREGCVGSGFCELGCSFDAKKNAMREFLPEAIKNGADVLCETRAEKLYTDGRHVTHLEARVIHPSMAKEVKIKIRAERFFCAAGAIETPLLLLRSKVPDPKKLIGERLHLHPGAAVVGMVNEAVESWKGIPQSYECTQFDDQGIWIVTASAHPGGAAGLLPGFGHAHQALMINYRGLAPLSVMIHDSTSGKVKLKPDGGARIIYKLNEHDRQQLGKGLKESARILLSAGAKSVVFPTEPLLIVNSISDLESTEIVIRDVEWDVVSVHPMSSVWMGRSWDSSCLTPQGRYHHLDNLFICDTSAYPTSIGVPPQITTYAYGMYVARANAKST